MAIRAWMIAEEGEVYAGNSEEEIKKYFTSLVGEQEAKESIECLFRELSDKELDAKFKLEDSPDEETSLRAIAEASNLPTQISSQY